MQPLKNANLAGLFTDSIWKEIYFTTKSTGLICLHDSKLKKRRVLYHKEEHLEEMSSFISTKDSGILVHFVSLNFKY